MHTASAKRQFTTWLVVMALLLAALAPAAARAVVLATGSAPWVEICSVRGVVWVKADAANASTENTSAPAESTPMPGMDQPCAWCGAHAVAAGLPPAAPCALAPLPQPHAVARLEAPAYTSAAWVGVQARGPPYAGHFRF